MEAVYKQEKREEEENRCINRKQKKKKRKKKKIKKKRKKKRIEEGRGRRIRSGTFIAGALLTMMLKWCDVRSSLNLSDALYLSVESKSHDVLPFGRENAATLREKQWSFLIHLKRQSVSDGRAIPSILGTSRKWLECSTNCACLDMLLGWRWRPTWSDSAQTLRSKIWTIK